LFSNKNRNKKVEKQNLYITKKINYKQIDYKHKNERKINKQKNYFVVNKFCFDFVIKVFFFFFASLFIMYDVRCMLFIINNQSPNRRLIELGVASSL